MKEDENEKRDKKIDVVAYDPFDQMDRIVRSTMRSALMPFRSAGILNDSNGFKIPDVDIKDLGNSIAISVDIPGVDKKDIDIKVKGDHITLRAEKSEEKETNKAGYYSKERNYIGYYREIPLPEDVKPNTAKAKYENGTLNLTIDKSESAKESSVKVE